MSSSDSDFELLVTEDSQDILDLWAQKLLENHVSKNERGVCNWEVTFLVNGNYPEEEIDIECNAYKKAETSIQEYNDRINKAQDKQRLESEQRKLEEDLRKYRELQARFGNESF
jgi:hypothetical protein